MVSIYVATKYNSLPDIIPTHWGITGMADAYSPKSVFSVFSTVLMSVGVGIIIYISSVQSLKSRAKLNTENIPESKIAHLYYLNKLAITFLVLNIGCQVLFISILIATVNAGSINTYIMWPTTIAIIGAAIYQTYLYYLTVYITINVMLKVIVNDKIRLLIEIMSIISLTLTSLNLLNVGSNYLNILNWYHYFYLGMILGKKKVPLHINKYICIIILNLMFIYSMFYSYQYWDLSFILTNMICVMSLFNLFYSMNNLPNLLIYLGKKSFFIYLNHMLFVGITKSLIIRLCPVLYIFSPIIVITFCLIEDKVVRLIVLRKSKEKYKKYLAIN